MAFLPFAATVGGWVTGAGGVSSLAAGAAGASAAATAGGIAIASTAASLTAAGLSVAQSAGAKKLLAPPPIKMIGALPEETVKKDEEKRRLSRMGVKNTLLTGPQGVLEPADVKRKILLGE